MRILLVASVLLCAVNLILLPASGAAFIAALLAEKGVHQSFWTLLGVAVGAVGTLLASKRVASENRTKESADVAASLHAEIADRAARCLNDYLKPWHQYQSPDFHQSKLVPRSWVSKFRPVDPVVYPAVASKLALLPPDALFPILQFYFRLDTVRRELDDVLADESFFAQSEFRKIRPRLSRVADRMQSVLGPATLALSSLSVVGADRIETAAAMAYPHVREKGNPLRDELRANRVAEKTF